MLKCLLFLQYRYYWGKNNASIDSMETLKFYNNSQKRSKLNCILQSQIPAECQYIVIFTSCNVFILISPLLSHHFLASEVAMHAVYGLLIACQQN